MTLMATETFHEAVVRAVDDTHRAFAETIDNPVAANAGRHPFAAAVAVLDPRLIRRTGQNGGDVVSGAVRHAVLIRFDTTSGAGPPPLNTASMVLSSENAVQSVRAQQDLIAGREIVLAHTDVRLFARTETLVNTRRIDESGGIASGPVCEARTVAAHVSSRVSCVNRLPEYRYKRLSPALATAMRFPEISAPTAVVPMPVYSSYRSAARNTRRFARWTAVRRRLPGNERPGSMPCGHEIPHPPPFDG
jgi:hypothetical protein